MLQKVVICGVDTSGLPLLSAKEQEELMIKLKAGDEDARERFIVGNMRLVLSLVRRFWAKKANADDVFQAGCVGLIKAIDNFDLSGWLWLNSRNSLSAISHHRCFSQY